MPDTSPYDLIAEFYDEDMGLNNPGQDIEFYVQRAVRAGGNILELGCGTGRITLPLVRAGCRTVGLDLSLPMLRRLQYKAAAYLLPERRRRLLCFCADMSAWALDESFALIICPFSAFTYLTEDKDRERMLDTVRRHLAADGIFILDLFVPSQEIISLPDDHVFHDYRRKRQDGTWLERTKTIRKNTSNQINLVCRIYRFLASDGVLLRSITAQSLIRCYLQKEMLRLLENAGFAVTEQYGDFAGLPYRDDANVMVFVCRPAAIARRAEPAPKVGPGRRNCLRTPSRQLHRNVSLLKQPRSGGR